MNVCLNKPVSIWPPLAVAQAIRHGKTNIGGMFRPGLSYSYCGYNRGSNWVKPEAGR